MDSHKYHVEVSLFDVEQYDGAWLPQSLEEAIDFLAAKLSEVPVEHRSTATIEIDSTTSHDMTLATISIKYKRPPTPAEIEKRKQEAITRAESQLAYLTTVLEQQQARIDALKSCLKGTP